MFNPVFKSSGFEFAIAGFLILFFAFLQTSLLTSYLPVTPNLILSALLAIIMSRFSWLEVASLILLAAIFLSWTPALNFSLLVLILTMLSLFLMRPLYSTERFFPVVAITVFATFIFYLVANFNFMINNIYIISVESLINSIVTLLLLKLLRYFSVQTTL